MTTIEFLEFEGMPDAETFTKPGQWQRLFKVRSMKASYAKQYRFGWQGQFLNVGLEKRLTEPTHE